jgi:chromosome segregation protein
MRLKKIKLAGFKSFVDPTPIHFPSNLMGIVGPNGCGKSNVIDAVKWVMGESSAKTLRGETMADVIFSGSNTRKPVGSASVELIFDNREGKLGGQYASFSEISVRRSVSRDGSSQYAFNGTRCRRRDITDVFLGTGLGARSYAIIEQGMVSKLIEAKPDELRVYLEEAAGISKYKERRKETANRIKHTRENLDRLTDLREELEKQLNHLKRQSEAAEKYKTFKQEERQKKAELLALKWKSLDQQAATRDLAIKEKENTLQKAVADQRELEAAIERSRAEHSEAGEAMNQVQARYYQHGAEITRLETAIKHTRDSRQQQQQELERLHQELREISEHVEQDRQNLASVEQQLTEGEPQLVKAREEQATCRADLDAADQSMTEWQQNWENINRDIARSSQSVQVETTRIDHIQRHIEQLIQRAQTIEEDQQALARQSQDDDLQQLKHLQQELDERESRVQQALEHDLEALSQQRTENAALAAKQDDSREALQQSRADLATLQSVQNAAYGGTIEPVMNWLRTTGLSEATRLAQNLQVDHGWERAVEAVLGHFLEAVCVRDEREYADKLSDLVEGRISIINESSSEPQASKDPRLLISKIKTSSNLSSLLHHVYFADDISSALAMRADLPTGSTIVTADGICIGHGWIRATVETDEEGVLQREQHIQSLVSSIQQQEQQYTSITEQLNDGRLKFRQLEGRRDENQGELNALHRQLSEVRAEINSRENALQQLSERAQRLATDIEKIQQELGQEKNDLQQAQQQLNEARESLRAKEEEKARLDDMRDEVIQSLQRAREETSQSGEQANRIAMQMESLKNQFESMQRHFRRMQEQQSHLQERKARLEQPATEEGEPLEVMETRRDQLLQERQVIEDELSQARKRVESIDYSLRELEQKRHAAEQSVQEKRGLVEQARMAWQEINVRCQGLVEQLQESDHDAKTLLEQLPIEASEAEWNEELGRIERRIARLGPINLAAIDEYKSSSERKEYLDRQDKDLTEALQTLENAMHKIDRETRTRFKDTFDQVNAGMKKMFPRLFGGGHGYLELTGEDLLETGVTVMARPPGKRNSSIHLLSGGEKAMTAVSLLFSMFQLNPAPFCMLDEIDAPLDDANIGRFCEVVTEMSKEIQFIVVTHSKMTMEMTKQLMGVTMQEPGVSRLVSVDIDEAVKMAS